MSKKITTIFLIALLCSCGSKTSYEEQIKQYKNFVHIADSLNKIKDYKESITASSKAIKITDTLPQAYLKRGDSYLGLKNYDKAKDDFSDVIKIEGEKSVAYKGRAIANYFIKEEDDFTEDIDIYIKYHADPYAHLLRGDYYAKKNKYDKAILDYSICIKNNPQNSILYLKRGNVYANAGKTNLSVNDYEIYTRLNPTKNNDLVFYKRALQNLKAKNYQKAIDDFALISELSSDLKIIDLTGDCFYNLEKYKDAIKNYSAYLVKDPNNYKVLEKRATSFLAIEDLKNADKDFKNVATLKWESKGFFYKYGWFILFIITYFTLGLIIASTVKEEYDNRKISKSYWYYFLTGLFGGHYLYLHYNFRYYLHSILIFTLLFINSFNIRSFYNHYNLLSSGALSSQTSRIIIYMIIILLVIDIILLPYFVFSMNHNLRLSINNKIPKQREIEINEISILVDKQNNKFKTLKL